MKDLKNIPRATIERLPLYYRYLDKVSTFEDIEVVSSKDIGGRLGIPSTQVRKDLSYYGEFGRRGVGYDVQDLKKSVGKILGANKRWPAIMVGAGNLGRALVNYEGFKKMGLEITAILDADLSKIGNKIGSITIQSMKNLKRAIIENNVRLGIMVVPANAAQEVADKLVEAGIKAIWNFAPVRFVVPDDIQVRNEDLAVGIVSLIYHLSWHNDFD
jgi:redox-sensing transcriptional repressor